MKRFPLTVAVAVALTATVSAQGKGSGTAKAPHAPAPKVAAAGSIKKPAAATASTSHDGSGRPARAVASQSKKSTSTSDSSTAPSTGTTPIVDGPPSNPVAIKINNNPAQLAKIQPQLDALGLTLEDATKGFRNQGQFIAALNAAKNRNLDFVALQEAMTIDGLSLGQAAKKVANTPPEPEPPPASTSTASTAQ
jgi:hypothetical protein